MPGFSSYDDLITELTTNGKEYFRTFYKVSSAPEAAGVYHGVWKQAGIPGAGANPATTPGTAYDDAAGSITYPDQASDFKHLVTFGAIANVACTLFLCDRLVGISGIAINATGDKTVNSAALPRYSGAAAAGVEAFYEVTTVTATTAAVVSLNQYTSQDGTTDRAGGTITFPAAATNVDTMVGPFPLQAGDTGIRSIEVGMNVATAAASGAGQIILLRRLAALYLPLNTWVERDLVLQLASMPRIYDGASLMLMIQATGTGAVTMHGMIKVAYG